MIMVMDPNLLPGARYSRWSWGLVAKGGVALCIAFGFGLMLGGFLPGPHSSGPFITERQLLSDGAHGIADILALRGHFNMRVKAKRVLFALQPADAHLDSEIIREARSLAEGLASRGHKVFVLGALDDLPNGVLRLNDKDEKALATERGSKASFDAVYTLGYTGVQNDLLLEWAESKHYITRLSTQHAAPGQDLVKLLAQHADLRLSIHAGSKWAAKCVEDTVAEVVEHPRFFSAFFNPTVSPSGGSKHMAFTESSAPTPLRFIYHGNWAHGAEAAVKIINQIHCTYPETELHIHSTPPTGIKSLCHATKTHDGWCHQHAGLESASQDEEEEETSYSDADYIILPLINLRDKMLHKPGQLPSAVLEAMAGGAIFVSADVGALSEPLAEAAMLVKVAEGSSQLKECADSKEPGLVSTEFLKRFVDAIDALEKDLDTKEALREKGKEWARAQLSQDPAEAFERALLSPTTERDSKGSLYAQARRGLRI